MSTALKTLIAGCSNPHIPGYLRSCVGDSSHLLHLLAVSEAAPERLEMAKNIVLPADPRVRFYADYRDMYAAHPEAEAVIIGSDNCDHLEMFRFFTEKKLHIHMMKVISMDHDECREMIDRGRNYCRTIDCELELHHNPQFAHARKLILSGALGKIRSIYLTNVSQCPGSVFPNWVTPELIYGKRVPLTPGSSICRGGAIGDHPHPFDLIPWMTGRPIVSVKAMSAPNQRAGLQVEDHAAVTGRLDDGTICFINPSYSNLEEQLPYRSLLWPKSLECNLKVTGDKGYFSCDYFDRPSFILTPGGPSPNRLIVGGTPRCGWESSIDLFYQAVTGARPRPEITLEEDFAAIRVMNAAYESISSGNEVTPEAE